MGSSQRNSMHKKIFHEITHDRQGHAMKHQKSQFLKISGSYYFFTQSLFFGNTDRTPKF
jgi:hypothetical protein